MKEVFVTGAIILATVVFLIAVIIAVCIVCVVCYICARITGRIIEGIKQGMDGRERHDR